MISDNLIHERRGEQMGGGGGGGLVLLHHQVEINANGLNLWIDQYFFRPPGEGFGPPACVFKLYLNSYS